MFTKRALFRFPWRRPAPAGQTPLGGRPILVYGGACLLCWGLISILMVLENQIFASCDDFFRLIFSISWSHDHFMAPPDVYWLPLQFWLYGLWYKVLGQRLGVGWHIPLSSLLMALGALGMMLAGQRLNERESIARNEGGPDQHPAAWFTLFLLLLTPISWRMAASGMSEPLFLAVQGWLIVCLAECLRKPSPGSWAGLLIAAMLGQLIRYEAWPAGFLAWGMAVLFAPETAPVAEKRFRRLIGGGLVLMIVPLVWAGLNQARWHHPLAFLSQAKLPILVDGGRPATLAERFKVLTSLALQQGWLVLLLAPVGVWLRRRDRVLRLVALYAFAIWMIYFQAAFSGTVSGMGRLCVSPLWISGALAAIPLATAWRGPVRQRRLLLLALTLLCVMHWRIWDQRHWGGFVIPPQELATMKKLRRLCRTEGYTVVIGDPICFEADVGGIMRVYVGLDHVLMRDWFSPERPVRGKYAYFVKDPQLGGKPPDGKMWTINYYFVDQMPPPATPDKNQLD